MKLSVSRSSRVGSIHAAQDAKFAVAAFLNDNLLGYVFNAAQARGSYLLRVSVIRTPKSYSSESAAAKAMSQYNHASELYVYEDAPMPVDRYYKYVTRPNDTVKRWDTGLSLRVVPLGEAIQGSSTIESIRWGKTAVVSESVLQGIMSDIQNHLDAVYPENNLQCFVDLLKDYRGYQVFHVSTAPATTFDPVLQYRVYLHDTTVAYMGDKATDESDIDVRRDYADTVCDIITKHVSTIPGRVTGSTVSAATQYPKTLKYLYVSEDLSDYSESVQAEYEDAWDDLLSTWEDNPRSVPVELWKSSEAFITKEDGWLQVSWGGLDSYEEFSTLSDCKDHVASQYPIFRWGDISSLPKSTAKRNIKPNRVNKGPFIYDGSVECPKSVKSVIIADGVTQIPRYAFDYRTRLTSVVIPNSVTTIDEGAFANCGNLQNITIPNSVIEIGQDAFANCFNLTSIVLPNKLSCISHAMFLHCSSLTSITIPDGVTRIDDMAFYGCSRLISITIPDSVTDLGSQVFAYCKSLTSVKLSNSITKLPAAAFLGCFNLEDIDIPRTVDTIGRLALGGCCKLTSIDIPQSVKTIESEAFEYCKGLESVIIRNRQCQVSPDAFEACPNVQLEGLNNIESSTAICSQSDMPGVVSSTLVLQDDYFYDTEKNLEDNGWDDILDWFRSNAWIHNGALIVPAGTKLTWVSEDRYYNTYKVYTPAGTQEIPFLKPEMGGDPLTTSQLSTPVTSSEYVEDFDDIIDDPNCREDAIQLIKDAAKAHNYIGDIDAEIEEIGSYPESLYQMYHDIIDVGTEVQSEGLGNWRFLLPSETEYDEPVIHTDNGYYVVCARGSIRLVSIDEDELFY